VFSCRSWTQPAPSRARYRGFPRTPLAEKSDRPRLDRRLSPPERPSLILTFIASRYGVGFGISMLIGTIFGAVNFIFALLVGPQTKGKVRDPDLVLASVGLRFPMHPGQACLRRCRHASPVRRPTPRACSVE